MKLSRQYDRYYQAQREARGILRDQFEPLRVFGQEARSLLQAQAQFKALNLGARDTALGFEAVEKTARQVGGVRLDNLTSDLIGLKSVFGDLHSAIEFLPTAAKTRFTFQALFNSDPKELEADILHTMKALEQMGAIRQLPGGGVDEERLEKYLDAAIRIKSYTGGRVGGRELRNFVQTSGVAGMSLDPEGLFNMMSMMEAMGGFQAGTSLMSAFMSFRALRQGAGGQRSAHAMAQLGLLDLNSPSIEWSREGRIKKLTPGALPISDLLGKDPLQFADALAEAIKQNGQKLLPKGAGPVDMTNADQIATILTQITGNRSSANVLSKMILMRENIRKDAEAAKQSMGLEEMNRLAENDPLGKILKLEAAVDNFRQKAGIPLLTTLAELGTSATPFLNFLGQHPKLAIWSIIGAKTASSFFQIANSLRQFRMAGKVTEALNQTGAAAEQAGKKVGWYRSSLGGIPAIAATTIALYGIPFLLEQIDKLKKERDEAWAQNKDTEVQGARSTAKLLASDVDASRATHTLRSFAPSTLSNFLSTYDDQRSWFYNWGQSLRGMTGMNGPLFAPEYETDKASALMKEHFPRLNIPSEFAFFLRAIKESKLPADTKSNLIEAAGKAFPESMKRFNEAMKQAGNDREAAERRLIELDKMEAQALAQSGQLLTDKFIPAIQGATERLNSLGMGGAPITLPEHAAGGLTRTDHFAKVHRNEVIAPLERVKDIFGIPRAGQTGRQTSSPSLSVTNNITVQVTGSGNVQDVQRAAYAGVRRAEQNLERMLNRIIRDRSLTGHTNI